MIMLFAILIFVGSCAHYQDLPQSGSNDSELNLVMTSTGYSWVAIRYDEKTGEAWFQFPYYWRTIGEKEPLDQSRYIIRLIGFGGNQWAAIRMDTHSGRCWMVQDSYWVEINDDHSITQAHGIFNLKMVSTGDNWKAIKYDENTGEAWLNSQENWLKVKDVESLPKSHYVVQMAGEYEWGWVIIRMDINSGSCWMIEKIKGRYQWVEMDMSIKS